MFCLSQVTIFGSTKVHIAMIVGGLYSLYTSTFYLWVVQLIISNLKAPCVYGKSRHCLHAYASSPSPARDPHFLLCLGQAT